MAWSNINVIQVLPLLSFEDKICSIRFKHSQARPGRWMPLISPYSPWKLRFGRKQTGESALMALCCCSPPLSLVYCQWRPYLSSLLLPTITSILYLFYQKYGENLQNSEVWLLITYTIMYSSFIVSSCLLKNFAIGSTVRENFSGESSSKKTF